MDKEKALTYSKYLRIKELTSLQVPLASPAAHDEMLFIVIHQVYELWFKLLNYEMVSLIQSIENDRLVSAFHSLHRIDEIFRVLIQQIDVLETMTPVEFNQFRSNLNPASGFQSLQFREFELLAGASLEDYEQFAKIDPEWGTTLQTRGTGPNLRKAFFSILKSKKLIAQISPEEISKAVLKVYQGEDFPGLRSLLEHLIRFDEQLLLWRFRHVQMVERMIGNKPGTGGSLGAAYLRTTLKKRMFPELWEARTQMGGATY